MGIPSDPRHWRVGLIGYGEVGRILAEDLCAQGLAVSTYDLKLGSPADAAIRAHAEKNGVTLARVACRARIPIGFHRLGRDGESSRSSGRGLRTGRSTRRVLP